MEQPNIFVDCSLEAVKSDFELYSQTIFYSYPRDFYLCKNIESPTKYCVLTKNLRPVRSYCFPQSCDGEKIHYFLGNIYRGDSETDYNIQCTNVLDPTIPFVLIGIFLTLIVTITFISTIIYSNPPKFLKCLPSKLQEYFQYFSIFSLSENFKTLFNTKSSSSSIDCLNGLKTLALIPIVFLHSLQAAWPYPDSKFYTLMLNVTGILPTDTFFVVSGILCAKFYISRGNLFSNFFKILFERYMRLIPSGVVVISIFLVIKILLVPLDVHFLFDQISTDCKNAWWAMIIFIQNYYDGNHMCFVTFWFATVLFQLYFFTPFVLLIIEQLKSFLNKIVMVLILILTFLPGFVSGLMNQSFYTFLYVETLTRSYPYLVGLFYYWLTFDSVKLVTNLQTKLAWTATLLTFVLALIPFFTDAFTKEMVDFFYIPVRIFWPFALCWTIHACHNGFGGIINNFLSAKFLIPFSNLSLGIYLVNVFASQALQLTFHFLPTVVSNLVHTILFFVANWIISTFCATLLYLYIEVPFHRMSRMTYQKPKDASPANTV